MSDHEPRLLTLAEAAAVTGLSQDAIRKRALRNKLRFVSGTKSNDGLFRVWLGQEDIDTLRPHTPAVRLDDVQTDRRRPPEDVNALKTLDATIATLRQALESTETARQAEVDRLSRMMTLLEQDAQRARQEAKEDREAAEAARQEAAAARAALEAERGEWTRRLDGLAAELGSMRDGRESDRRRAMAAIERIQQAARDARGEAAELKDRLDQVLANQAAETPSLTPERRPGLLARLLRRR